MTATDPETLRTTAWNTLVHCIMSKPELWSTVEMAEVRVRLAPELAAIPDRPLSLAPLMGYLAERGAPEDTARELVRAFVEQANRGGVDVPMPEGPAAVPAPVKRQVPRPTPRHFPAAAVGVAPAKKAAPIAPNAGTRRGAPSISAAVIGLTSLLAFALGASANGSPSPDLDAALAELCAAVRVEDDVVTCRSKTSVFEAPDRAAATAAALSRALHVTIQFEDELRRPVDPGKLAAAR